MGKLWLLFCHTKTNGATTKTGTPTIIITYFSYFSDKTYVMGTLENSLNETILLFVCVDSLLCTQTGLCYCLTFLN